MTSTTSLNLESLALFISTLPLPYDGTIHRVLTYPSGIGRASHPAGAVSAVRTQSQIADKAFSIAHARVQPASAKDGRRAERQTLTVDATARHAHITGSTLGTSANLTAT